MVTKNRYISCCFVFVTLLFVYFANNSYAGITASVDRNKISLNETFTLKITKEGTSFFSKPDFSSLERDFRIINQGQSSSTQIINGNVSSSVSWNLTLMPLREGTLTIPAIRFGKEESNSIEIFVSKETSSQTAPQSDAIFIETDIDKQEIYVQEQLVFTLRILIAVDAELQASKLKLDDAVVEDLDTSQFRKVINGKSYRVVEQKYAVFPQKSGTLEIPSLLVKAALPQQRRFNDSFDPFGSLFAPGKTLAVRSSSKTVKVKEKPEKYPAGEEWLPSDKLSIAEEWSKEPENLEVGESVTVNITLTAEGLPGAKLPPITLPELEGLKLYQSKAEVENQVRPDGVSGVRKESIALIQVKPGNIGMPEIRIPWWNKKNEAVEYAVLSAKDLKISGTPEEHEVPPQADMQTKAPSVSGQQVEIPGSKPTAWITLSLVLAVAWLTTLYFLAITRRQLKQNQIAREDIQTVDVVLQEKEAFKMLEKFCLENDLRKTRKALIRWVQLFKPDAAVRTFADIEHIRSFDGLKPYLREIESQLFSNESLEKTWSGENILKAVSDIRKQHDQKVKQNEALQPLYK
jgi:hypothetical protein